MEPEAAFEHYSIEAIKTLGKTLGQMNLYKIGHPAVVAMLSEMEASLSQALSQTQGELSYSIDQEKLIANGRIIGSINSLPTHIKALFDRFKLNSLAFQTGLTNEELVAFLELASSRPDAATAADPQAYLQGKGVTHIIFTETIYTKMSEEALNEALEQNSLEDTIRALVGNAIGDPKKRQLIYDKVMDLLKEDIEKRVEEVIGPLREAKGRLENEQARTTSVLQNMFEGVVVVDEGGKVLMMNPAAEQMTGTTLAQAAGTALLEGGGADQVVSLASELATPHERPIETEVKVESSEDTQKTVRASSAIVQNQAGKVVGMVSGLTDAAKHRELDKKEREFVAHVTHELRSPLSSIRAALEILEEEFHSRIREDENRILKSAISNSERLEKLIDTILDFSKVESGRMTVYPKEAEAGQLVEEAVGGLKPWAAKKKLDLSSEVVAQLPPVWADPARTVQILTNLIGNAVKYTPEGRITVGAVMYPPSPKFVQFYVRDTGKGIPKDQQASVFEKFVQIAAGEKHVGGVGLGLGIAKALVQLHGGEIWLQSEEGRGTTFFFTIPVKAGAESDAAKAPEGFLTKLKKSLGL